MNKTLKANLDFEQLFKAAPCGLLVIDRQAAIQYVNPAARAFLGLSESQTVIGKQLAQALPQWNSSEFHASLPSLLNAQSTFQSITFDVPGATEDIHLSLAAAIVSEPHGESRWILLMLSESTQEVATLERRLQRSEYQASIGKLARGIAHELNSPLDGVLRYVHLAMEQLPQDSSVRDYLSHVQEGLNRMVRAVKAFLEFSRQVTTPVNRLADLNRLVEDALLLVQHRAKFQRILVVSRLQPDLPAVADAGLQHAIVNLIKNAFDAMPHGGTLTVTTRVHDSRVHLDIADTGTGIPEEIRSRIFEPFFSTKPIHQGNGLGLMISKEGVERSGGTLAFTSCADLGTTFHMYLPVPVRTEAAPHGT